MKATPESVNKRINEFLDAYDTFFSVCENRGYLDFEIMSLFEIYKQEE